MAPRRGRQGHAGKGSLCCLNVPTAAAPRTRRRSSPDPDRLTLNTSRSRVLPGPCASRAMCFQGHVLPGVMCFQGHVLPGVMCFQGSCASRGHVAMYLVLCHRGAGCILHTDQVVGVFVDFYRQSLCSHTPTHTPTQHPVLLHHRGSCPVNCVQTGLCCQSIRHAIAGKRQDAVRLIRSSCFGRAERTEMMRGTTSKSTTKDRQ